MYKDIIISVLAAELLIRHPWFVVRTGVERMALVVGIASAVFIFLLFLEDCWDKYQNYRKRVQKTGQIVKKLREGGSG